jgi:hypothetical protein
MILQTEELIDDRRFLDNKLKTGIKNNSDLLHLYIVKKNTTRHFIYPVKF